MSGRSSGGVGDGVLDDPVGEGVARPVEGVALEARPDVGAQGGEVGEVAQRPDEVVVEVGLDLLAKLPELDLEVGRLAGQLGLRVVVREGDVEALRAADLEPDQVGLEARDQPLLAEDQRHPLRAAALERLAVARPGERDHGVVAVPGAPVLDGREGRVLVAQLVDDLVDLGVVDRVDLGLEVEVLVVAERDLGADLDRRLEDERLALLGLHDLDVGVGQRQDVLLDEGLAVRASRRGARRRRRARRRGRDGVRARAAAPCPGGSRGRGCAGTGAGPTRRWPGSGSSGGSSISSTTVDLGAGVEVICIAREV